MQPGLSSSRAMIAGLLLVTALVSGCASVGTFFSFLGGEVVVTQAQLQQRLDRRFPREFKLRNDALALTLSQPSVTLPRDANQLTLAFDMQLQVSGLRHQPQGHFALVSGLRYDPATYSLYLHEPRLTTLELPLAGALPGGGDLQEMGNALLEEFARTEPVYTLSERRRNEIPLGRSIDRVDIDKGQVIIRVSR